MPNHRTEGGRARDRGTATRQGSRRKPRPRAGARKFGVVALSLLVLAVAGGGWLYIRLHGNIDTFDADGLSRHRPESGAGGQNVLVIGSDARTGGNDKLGGGAKDDIGRSDTALLLHVYQDSRHAAAVSFPRDTLVDIPPCKLPKGGWTRTQRQTMFNEAFSVGQSRKGNPACTQNTVEKLTGLRVDHTVVVDFKGFATMTEAVGGVPVCVPKDLYQGDLNPNRGSRGKRVFRRGEQTVAGQRALDYVRIRHGIGDGSDIGRIKRQQAFVGSLLKKVKEDGLNPTTLLPLANAATKSMTVDEGLGTPRKMVDFAMSLRDVSLESIRFVTIPWRYQGNRVAVVQPDADELWKDLRADRPLDAKDTDRAKKERERKDAGKNADKDAEKVDGQGRAVSVYNGTATPGLAASAATQLRDRHFTVARSGNATTQDHTTTVVSHGPGERSDARELARLFPGATVEQSAQAGLSVTLGTDYQPGKGEGDTGGDKGGEDKSPPRKSRSAADDPCADLSYG
ncbi:LCP family protein [Streptomyces sp. NPDC005438]|uniref:LCP family protein n=1 Tax=Streptomyces sp. NPDC005438 TaxID=3156880 RepID=UPI0033AED8A2